jgi:hypothetical protein
MSIRRRQPPHRELDLTVGKLPPVFDDRHVATGRISIQDLPGLRPGLLERQRERFSDQTIVAFDFAIVT